MSFGDWLRQLKVGRSLGLAVALLLATAIGAGLWITMPPDPKHQSLEPFTSFFNAIDPECASLLANPASFPGTTPYKIDDCEDKAVAQRKGYRDLDQATRSANAAEDGAWLSLLQARASVIGAAFLVLTLFATAWAASAAADAAKIAQDSVSAAVRAANAAEASLRTDRAWISSSDGENYGYTGWAMGAWQKDARVFALRWINSGNTPALNTRIVTLSTAVKKGDPVPRFQVPVASISSGELKEGAVGPRCDTSGVPIILDDAAYAALKKGETDVYLYGLALYRDIFTLDTERTTEVCYRVLYRGEQREPNGEIRPLIQLEHAGAQQGCT